MVQLLLALLRLDDILHDLRLLNEERTHNAGAHAVRAARATVRTVYGLLALRHLRILAGAQSLDTRELRVAVTALGRSGQLVDVQVTNLAVGGLDNTAAVRLGVVGVALAQGETLSHLVSLLYADRRTGRTTHVAIRR